MYEEVDAKIDRDVRYSFIALVFAIVVGIAWIVSNG